MICTAASVHPLSTAHLPARYTETLQSARSALHACLLNDTRTHCSASTERCTHACQVISTPASVNPLRTAYMPVNTAQAHALRTAYLPAKYTPAVHPLKCTSSAPHTYLPNCKQLASTPAQHCMHACHTIGAADHPLSIAYKPGK